MKVTYFPVEEEYKVFTDDFKVIAEGFNSRSAANEYIAKATGAKIHDIYLMWNREFHWCHYGIHVGDEGLEDYKKSVLYQGDGARVKKVRSELRDQ